jgi:hypothetical protein
MRTGRKSEELLVNCGREFSSEEMDYDGLFFDIFFFVHLCAPLFVHWANGLVRWVTHEVLTKSRAEFVLSLPFF